MKKTTFTYYITAILLLCFLNLQVTNVRSVSSQDRWYAGYYGGNIPEGVEGKIYMILPGIPVNLNQFCAQWVSIILSYSPERWIQIGYVSRWTICVFFPCQINQFYVEKNDGTRELETLWWIAPLVGHTYRFKLLHDGPTIYHFYWGIFEGPMHIIDGSKQLAMFSTVDLQALSEQTSTQIDIDYTHFFDLKYYNYPGTGGTWMLWDTYDPYDYDDPPYQLIKISPHEFYANTR